MISAWPRPVPTGWRSCPPDALWHLDSVPGFVAFHLMKGPEGEDHTLYASHTVWQDRATFEAWTRSEAFRAAHRNAGSGEPLFIGHPNLETFESVAGA